ncbi:hypothetical protein DEO72_LG7g1351 [Vigna unguiculata]|uniref:Uncharacterized protein n=1 Tax=Vigna unguiculata TaxID=3917 RepID=A0A4D6MK21_VIGUN|nr:hypothetical protein DEO72_LG7g1351 [Vigna unguiculata]
MQGCSGFVKEEDAHNGGGATRRKGADLRWPWCSGAVVFAASACGRLRWCVVVARRRWWRRRCCRLVVAGGRRGDGGGGCHGDGRRWRLRFGRLKWRIATWHDLSELGLSGRRGAT